MLRGKSLVWKRKNSSQDSSKCFFDILENNPMKILKLFWDKREFSLVSTKSIFWLYHGKRNIGIRRSFVFEVTWTWEPKSATSNFQLSGENYPNLHDKLSERIFWILFTPKRYKRDYMDNSIRRCGRCISSFWFRI